MADENRTMNDQSIDRALREALDVSPSPDFVARVRTRIANEPVPHSLWSRWTVWMPVTVGAVAAAIALAVLVKPAPQVPLKPDTSEAAVDVPLPLASTVRLKADTTTIATTPTRVSGVVSGFPSTTLGAGGRTVVARKEPEILISQSESAALRRLIARASEGQIIVDVFSASASDSSGELQPLPEITIPLLKIDPLVPVNGEEGVRQ